MNNPISTKIISNHGEILIQWLNNIGYDKNNENHNITNITYGGNKFIFSIYNASLGIPEEVATLEIEDTHFRDLV